MPRNEIMHDNMQSVDWPLALRRVCIRALILSPGFFFQPKASTRQKTLWSIFPGDADGWICIAL